MPARPKPATRPELFRAWQRMLSGRRLDLLDPAPKDIEIEDIAHGLARVARWNGQTVGDHAYSVAQHALLVEEIASAIHPDLTHRWRLAALLHDAPEYVIGDLISPFKAAIGLDYKAFETKLLEAIQRSILRQGLGEIHGIDAARGRARRQAGRRTDGRPVLSGIRRQARGGTPTRSTRTAS